MRKIQRLICSFIIICILSICGGCIKGYQPQLEEGESYYTGMVSYEEVSEFTVGVILCADQKTIRDTRIFMKNINFTTKVDEGTTVTVGYMYALDGSDERFEISEEGNVRITFKKSKIDLQISDDFAEGEINYVFIMNTGRSLVEKPFGTKHIILEKRK